MYLAPHTRVREAQHCVQYARHNNALFERDNVQRQVRHIAQVQRS